MPTNHDKRFESPDKGAEALNTSRDAWTEKLGDRSVEASYAVIAGVWAIYGQTPGMFSNRCALLAMTLALVHIGLNLLLSLGMIELLECRFRFSQDKPDQWNTEWEKSADVGSEWPYTPTIARVGKFFHRMKGVVPILAAGSLIVSLWTAAPTLRSEAPALSGVPNIGIEKNTDPIPAD